MTNIMSLVLPFLIGGVVGIAIGAIVALLFTSNRKEEKPELPDPQPVELLPEGVTHQQHTRLVRLWRERASGKLAVEVNGKLVPDAAGLTPPQRSALEAAIREWALWMGLGKAPAKQGEAPAKQGEAPAKPVQASSAPEQAVVKAVEAPARPAPVTPPAAPVADTRPKSMVEQIDDIVQDMLPHSTLAGRTLRVRSDIKEGVLVWLDGKSFAGIGEVDDPQAKALLQAAAAEWEKRTAREHGWG